MARPKQIKKVARLNAVVESADRDFLRRRARELRLTQSQLLREWILEKRMELDRRGSSAET